MIKIPNFVLFVSFVVSNTFPLGQVLTVALYFTLAAGKPIASTALFK